MKEEKKIMYKLCIINHCIFYCFFFFIQKTFIDRIQQLGDE